MLFLLCGERKKGVCRQMSDLRVFVLLLSSVNVMYFLLQ